MISVGEKADRAAEIGSFVKIQGFGRNPRHLSQAQDNRYGHGGEKYKAYRPTVQIVRRQQGQKNCSTWNERQERAERRRRIQRNRPPGQRLIAESEALGKLAPARKMGPEKGRQRDELNQQQQDGRPEDRHRDQGSIAIGRGRPPENRQGQQWQAHDFDDRVGGKPLSGSAPENLRDQKNAGRQPIDQDRTIRRMGHHLGRGRRIVSRVPPTLKRFGQHCPHQNGFDPPKRFLPK
ncbi:hypothetical protein [Amorphus sp. 3PC139-8]|uniref:hypothetical protein n=1 Tax=Amorphus sp. 3PC139-8 TaxID=2735676 RepID=UPI00345E0308